MANLGLHYTYSPFSVAAVITSLAYYEASGEDAFVGDT